MKKVFEFINRNGILSSLIASVIFAFCIYFFSIDKRILSFKEVTHEMLYDKNENFGLTIFANDSIKLDKNIFFLEVDLWNQGNKPIEQKDIKDNFGLKLEEGFTFLANSKVFETHKEVTKSEILLDSIKSKLYLTFEFLEKGNGIKVKTYYVSDSKEKSSIEPLGYIAQNTIIRHFNSTFTEKYRIWIALVVWIIGLALMIWTGNKISNKIDELFDKYLINYLKNKVVRRIAGLLIYFVILWYFLVKVLSKIPKWIYEFIADYFNRDSPF